MGATVTKEEKADYMREYRKRNPEKVRAIEAATKARNREKVLARKKEYREKNAEKVLAYNAAYQRANPELRAKWQESYKAKRPDVYAKAKVTRRTCERRIVPWYDRAAVSEIYRECKRISELTGIPHHVDHIIPLKNKQVCGLHVQDNLQVIPAKDNFYKSNKWGP